MNRFWSRALVAAGVLAGMAVAEPACRAALAVAAGKKPRYTARLSSNPVIRRQQLIVDPDGIVGGSVSVRYDPAVVSLSDVLDPADFRITGGFVEVIPEPGAISSNLEPLDRFLAGEAARKTDDAALGPIEVGYVQVFFDRKPTLAAAGPAQGGLANSVIPNLPGFRTVAADGPTGVNDTHALIFDYLPAPDGRYQPRAAYTIFALPPRTGFVSDTLVFGDDPDHPVGYREIGSAMVAGGLEAGSGTPGPIVVPLPPAVWTGLLSLGGLLLVQNVRRRRGLVRCRVTAGRREAP